MLFEDAGYKSINYDGRGAFNSVSYSFIYNWQKGSCSNTWWECTSKFHKSSFLQDIKSSRYIKEKPNMIELGNEKYTEIKEDKKSHSI